MLSDSVCFCAGWGRSSLGPAGLGPGMDRITRPKRAGGLYDLDRGSAAGPAAGSLGHRTAATAVAAVAAPTFSTRRGAGRGSRGGAGGQSGRGAAAAASGVGSFGHLRRPGAEPKAKRRKPEVILTCCN